MAAACAEIVGLPPTLLLTMKQRHCAFIQATPGDEEHDPEHWALGLCLLAAKAKSPPTIDHVEVVFIHRAASSTQISPILISLTAAERHVEFYAFGAGRPVQLIFPSGELPCPLVGSLARS